MQQTLVELQEEKAIELKFWCLVLQLSFTIGGGKKESCGNPITTCFHGSYPLGAPNIHLSLQKKMLRGNICFRDREDQQPQDDDAKDDEPHGKHAGRSNLNLACGFCEPFLETTF